MSFHIPEGLEKKMAPPNWDALILAAEKMEFDQWIVENMGKNKLFRNAPTGDTREMYFKVWQGRGARQSKCRGVVHPGCNYLAVCGSVCNKCGQIA